MGWRIPSRNVFVMFEIVIMIEIEIVIFFWGVSSSGHDDVLAMKWINPL